MQGFDRIALAICAGTRKVNPNWMRASRGGQGLRENQRNLPPAKNAFCTAHHCDSHETKKEMRRKNLQRGLAEQHERPDRKTLNGRSKTNQKHGNGREVDQPGDAQMPFVHENDRPAQIESEYLRIAKRH
jgi:hypothetical protein